MEFTFNQTQVLTSPRMQRNPKAARLISKIFGYTALGNYARAKVFLKLLRKIPLEKVNKMLDLGCGMGEYSLMMAKNFPNKQVTAIDLLPDRVAAVRNAGNKMSLRNLDVQQLKLEELPQDQRFDFIFSVDVFEHILPHEMPFTEAYKRLNKGGYFLVKMPSERQETIFPDHWFEEHQAWLHDEHVGQVYELPDLVERFKAEGFKIVYAGYYDGLLSRLGWELAFLAKKGGNLLHLFSLPLAKFLVWLDMQFSHNKHGNTIQVIGQK